MKFNKVIHVKCLECHLAERNSANINNPTTAIKVHKIPRAYRHPNTRDTQDKGGIDELSLRQGGLPVTIVCLNPAQVKPKSLPNFTPTPFQLDVAGGNPQTTLIALSSCSPTSDGPLVQPG